MKTLHKQLTILLTFFLGTALLFSQTDAEKELQKRITENRNIIYSEPEKAFEEAKAIEKEARKINAKQQELHAIEIQCYYYGIIKDFENLLATGKKLYQKAETYKMPVYQVRAKRQTFEDYVFSDLPDKAFSELEQASKIIDKMDKNDPVTIDDNIRLLGSYSNYYWSQGNLKNQLKYTLLAGEELKKIPNEKQRELLLFIQYSNISGIYTELNQMDSAKVYAELSQLKYKEAYKRNDVVAQNFWTLGKVAEHEKNYPKALLYFKKAEKLEGYKNHSNLELIYNDIITSYENLQHEDSVRIYQIKRDSLKLAIAENQKKSLTTLLNEKKENNNQWLYYTLGVLLVFILILIFSIRRKNKILAEQEKISQQYLAKISENPTGEYYSKLLKALKEKDPAFMFYFEETFPDFSSKLIQINPKISVADIEFCALLKIKIPTKEIAKYKYFEMQTVRNKKYLIRKKLNIPKESDIYQWLDEL